MFESVSKRNMRVERHASPKVHSRAAVTLMELLVVTAILSLILAIAFPAVQAARETARLVQCENRLKNIALATLAYESANGHLPPGTLGHSEAFPWDGNRYNPESEFYWKHFQHTSSLALIGPYLEDGNLAEQLDRIGFDVGRTLLDFRDDRGNKRYDWFGRMIGFEQLTQTRQTVYLCPSAESGANAEFAVGAIQPVTHEGQDSLTWLDLKVLMSVDHQRTNYAACLGAYSGGQTEDSELTPYVGLMSSRSKTRLSQALDGQSSTVIFGENIGRIFEGEQTNSVSWLVGGVCRGRSMSPWGMHGSEVRLLGDARNAEWVGFASAHPAGVVFAFADGHVDRKSRDVESRVVYAMCGRSDGSTLHASR